LRLCAAISPHAKAGKLPPRYLDTRELDKPTKEEKQMTVASPTDASSYDLEDWHAINWQKAHQNVRRLQARIVKATKEGWWGKVKALQRLLTHSFSGKALAVKQVTENRGKRTPGIDGEVWRTPAGKWRAIHALRPRGTRWRPAGSSACSTAS
jgi:RNA-directed DNA polymerase